MLLQYQITCQHCREEFLHYSPLTLEPEDLPAMCSECATTTHGVSNMEERECVGRWCRRKNFIGAKKCWSCGIDNPTKQVN